MWTKHCDIFAGLSMSRSIGDTMVKDIGAFCCKRNTEFKRLAGLAYLAHFAGTGLLAYACLGLSYWYLY